MVDRLTEDALQRARDFVAQHARPLERARFAHLIDGAPVQAVIDKLTEFQVDSGGFGRALEPDVRAPEASVIATLTALDIARMHRVPADHPLVEGACTWLLHQAQADERGRIVWPFLPASAQHSPHAPWWDQSEPGQLADTFSGFLANPGLALTAHLFRYAAAAPGHLDLHLLETLSAQARELAGVGLPPDEVNAHDAAAHLAGELTVPEPLRREWGGYLAWVLPDRIMATPQDFGSYGIHPLWIAPAPTHPLAAVIYSQVMVALDQVIASQREDGSWEPFWDWGGQHPDEWSKARREWQGSLVIRNLDALKNWDRLEV